MALLMWRVREPRKGSAHATAKPPLSLLGARQLPRGFWLHTLLGAGITLARFSDAFLVLRAQDLGLPIGQVPLVMMVMQSVASDPEFPVASGWGCAPPYLLLKPTFTLQISSLHPSSS